MKYLKLIILMVIALFTVDLVVNFKSSAKFQIGECGANSLFPGIRKIESVDSFVYNYCILVDNKCSASYSMRINNFDRIMEKTKCIKERQ